MDVQYESIQKALESLKDKKRSKKESLREQKVKDYMYEKFIKPLEEQIQKDGNI